MQCREQWPLAAAQQPCHMTANHHVLWPSYRPQGCAAPTPSACRPHSQHNQPPIFLIQPQDLLAAEDCQTAVAADVALTLARVALKRSKSFWAALAVCFSSFLPQALALNLEATSGRSKGTGPGMTG